MQMPISDPSRQRPTNIPPAPTDGFSPAERIAQLTERQLSYLRLVQQNYTSKEIAKLEGVGYRAVDKQLFKANNILGTSSRLESVRMLTDYQAGVGLPYPAIDLPSVTPTFPLPSVLPNAGAAANMLSWKQAAIWTAIISVVTPVGLTAAGMAILTLVFLLGPHKP